MYCDNCGGAVPEGASFCDACGAPTTPDPRSGSWYTASHQPQPVDPRQATYPVPTSASYAAQASSRYCGGCGAAIHPRAYMCPRCGAPVSAAGGNKSKTTAVLLACFLGPWTWLYTYKLDSKKFWIGICVPAGALVVVIIASAALSSSATDCQYPYNGCSPLSTGTSTSLGLAAVFLILFFVTYVGIHIWGIVDTAMKKDWYYTNFPNG